MAGILVAGAVSTCAQIPTDVAKESPARSQVQQLIAQAHADVSVAFRSLDGTQQLFINKDEEFPAAPALIQIPIMIELYAEARAGELHLADPVTVGNNFASIVTGANYQIDPKSDPDQDLYRAIGRTITLRELCEHMVARNSSLAAALLIEKLGIDRIRQRIESLDADGFQLYRGMESNTANDRKPDNTASARAMFESLWTLAKGQDEGDEASTEMVGMMGRTAFSQRPTAGMPPDPRAGKSAQLAAIAVNAMIVYGPHPFVVVIVVRGITNAESRADLMALIEHALAAGLDTAL